MARNLRLVFVICVAISLLAVLAVAQTCFAGSVRWTADGVPVCSNKPGYKFEPQATSDGAGGAILVWEDGRGSGFDIYAQRVSSNETPMWTSNGVSICAASRDQKWPRIVRDGFGGAVITWQDGRNNVADVYAQRVNLKGVTQWTYNGVAVCISGSTSPFPESKPQLYPDGSGGAIITWKDERLDHNDNIYARRVPSNGVPAGPANGVLICSATGTQTDPQIGGDGSGHAIIAWDDSRGSTNAVYAQKVDLAVNPSWASNGIAVCVAAGAERTQVTGDGSGGAIVTWDDYRSSGSNSNPAFPSSNGKESWLDLLNC